ncbi:hypothetical protein LTR56_001995 [Elasticomyces elasticus]|nr:hypothetical protein LTR56_024975 [Elasticomyces elasticus]KAK3631035.1 hypothetical protein LTR22_021261 [Elasticomyces elasticus]KAK3652630.1 hypothetical protein LTR22_011580 [Elasticomyces elasticus]KAK3658139.1 hypothetical protein LTR56_001995 [Elasticomyces elasticus]KAK4902077.1 hypothetical protein LTR27_000979 [Elasticomyces elasticus]
MDVVQDWAAYFLDANNVAALSAYSPYLYSFYNALNIAKSWLLHLIDQVSRKPDLATIALLLIIVLVSLKILDMLWQTLLFWVRLVRRVVFWGGAAALGMWLYSRGPAGMMEDLQYWQSTWSGEYSHWKEKEQIARNARQGVNYGGQRQQGRWF